MLLNITNDHLDWHGSMQNYINSKFKIFESQKSHQYSIVNHDLKSQFKKRKLQGKLIIPHLKDYFKIKHQIKNSYIRSDINDENMSAILSLFKILRINKKNFLNSLKSFKGLPHRYEIFYKKKLSFYKYSKATSFQATKFALKNTKNTFWIVGGLPKLGDRLILKKFEKKYYKILLNRKKYKFF